MEKQNDEMYSFNISNKKKATNSSKKKIIVIVVIFIIIALVHGVALYILSSNIRISIWEAEEFLCKNGLLRTGNSSLR